MEFLKTFFTEQPEVAFPLLAGAATLFFIVTLSIFLQWYMKRAMERCIATLGLQKYEQNIGYKKPLVWLKGNYNGREYWLSFVRNNSRNRRVNPVIFMVCSGQNPRSVFDNLYASVMARAGTTARLAEKMGLYVQNSFNKDQMPIENQKVFRSMLVTVALYETLFPKRRKIFVGFTQTEMPQPPFSAPEKYIARVELQEMPPRPKDVTAVLEAMTTAGV